MASLKDKSEEYIANFMIDVRSDPLMFAKAAYPWGEGELAGSAGPRKWQAEVFGQIRDHLKSEKRFTPFRLAVASGHSIGKSAAISMICNWAMSTCVDCKIVITANTENQLLTKTMPEIGKWFRMAINAHWFKTTATSIYAAAEDHEREWRLNAIPWSDTSTESFAGLHNKGKRIVIIFDEASNINDKIWEVVEGALTDENTEIIFIAFGNPTRNTGRFRDCFGQYSHRWNRKQIDARNVEGINLELLKEWEDDYGEESDFFKVRVRGEFPSAGSKQFIPTEYVSEARVRPAEAKLMDPLIMGVDVGRFNDATVICMRRGRDARTIPMVKMYGQDTTAVADRIARMVQSNRPDAVFIDEGGIGIGVLDRLRLLRVPNVQGINFGSSASDINTQTGIPVKYANKRSEMWGGMKEWLENGAIPDDPNLAAQLISVEYDYDKTAKRDGAIILQSKKDMRRMGLPSPDEADALALTFAMPVFPSQHGAPIEYMGRNSHQSEYNPLSQDWISRDLNRKN